MARYIISQDGRMHLEKGRIFVDGKRTNFYLTEMVSRRVYEAHGDWALLLLRTETVVIEQKLRDAFGPLTKNNWYEGGPLNQRGYRSDWTKVGAKNSAHRYHMGGDVSSRKVSSDRMRRAILDDQAYWKDEVGISRIESAEYAPTWLHWDSIETKQADIRIVKPARKKRVWQESRHLNWK